MDIKVLLFIINVDLRKLPDLRIDVDCPKSGETALHKISLRIALEDDRLMLKQIFLNNE